MDVRLHPHNSNDLSDYDRVEAQVDLQRAEELYGQKSDLREVEELRKKLFPA